MNARLFRVLTVGLSTALALAAAPGSSPAQGLLFPNGNGNRPGREEGRTRQEERRLQREQRRGQQNDPNGVPPYPGAPAGAGMYVAPNNPGQNYYPNQGAAAPSQPEQLVASPTNPGYFYYPSNPGQLYYYPGQAPAASAPAASAPAATAPAAPEQLVASPTNPGYFYYPSNPAQLYYYPGQTPAASTTTAAATTTTPTTTAPAPNPTPPARQITVSLINPASFGVPLNFTVDDKPYTLPSGYTQTIDANERSVIAFSRGGSFGEARYTLSEAAYEFQFNDKGWDIHKKKPSAPVPNETTAAANTSSGTGTGTGTGSGPHPGTPAPPPPGLAPMIYSPTR